MDFKLTGGGKTFRTKKLMKGGGRKMKGGTRKLIDDMNNKEIMAKIQQYLPIRKEMKDKHGEVFTPYELIKSISPDVLVKGEDWRDKVVVGSDIVKDVRFVELVEGNSTTNIIEKINSIDFAKQSK